MIEMPVAEHDTPLCKCSIKVT